MFQTNKATSLNDHSAIVKKPIGLKAPYNSSGTISRDPRESSGATGMERENREHRERERDRANVRDINSSQKVAIQYSGSGHSTGQLKRSPSFSTSVTAGNSHIQHGPPPMKKHKVASPRDVTVAEAGKYGTLNDYAFFDKVSFFLRVFTRPLPFNKRDRVSSIVINIFTTHLNLNLYTYISIYMI